LISVKTVSAPRIREAGGQRDGWCYAVRQGIIHSAWTRLRLSVGAQDSPTSTTSFAPADRAARARQHPGVGLASTLNDPSAVEPQRLHATAGAADAIQDLDLAPIASFAAPFRRARSAPDRQQRIASSRKAEQVAHDEQAEIGAAQYTRQPPSARSFRSTRSYCVCAS
jgi:hypothetical protein